MEVNKDTIDLNIKPSVKDDRKDPTTFLPEEAMSYEIKPKKKKKKKKQEDPFKDIEEKVKLPTPTIYEPAGSDMLETECIQMSDMLDPMTDNGYEPNIAIKVENIEVELDINDFANDNSLMMDGLHSEDSQEVEVKIERTNDALHPIFDDILGNTKKFFEQNVVTQNRSLVCHICHLVFQTTGTLRVHQRRKHKLFRKQFKHVCDYCGMSYEVKNSLAAHIKRKHGPDAPMDDNEERTCDVCALVFKGMARLRMHMRRKHGSFEDSFQHVCKVCGLTYDKYRSLVVHMKRKHSKTKKPIRNEWFNCPFCPKVYTRRETYTRHVQRNHKVEDDGNHSQELPMLNTTMNEKTGEITCKECRLVFSSVNYLKLHMRRKHNAFKENFRLKCKICNLSYDKLESLKRHIRRKHDQGSYCEVCHKQFDSRELYLNHSHEKSVNECSICGLIFASQGGLGKHLRCTHRLDTPKTIFCNICNEGFHDKRQLKPHFMRVHLKVSYTCRYCNKVFKAKESYRRHILCKHPIKKENSDEQKCDQCSEVFSDEFELCRHVNIKHGKLNDDKMAVLADVKTEDVDKTQHHCQKCSQSFSVFEDLRVHHNQNHQIVEETQCQICGQLLPVNELQKHIKTTHTETFSCKYCDYETDNKTSMTQHYLRHKNAKTLHCNVQNCKYKTYYESAMQKHINRHNEQGVKFQCTQCPFQTMNKYILRYHEEAHVTGKKRYTCDQCDYATVLPANLVQHKYKHSKEKRFRCEFCPFATKYNTSLRFHVKKKHCDLPS